MRITQTCLTLLVLVVFTGCIEDGSNAGQIHLIEFYSDNCPWCAKQSPVVDRLEKDYGHVEFRRLHVQHDVAFASQYEVTAVPTIVLLVDGEVAGKWVGWQSYEKLAKELDKYPQANPVNEVPSSLEP